MSKMKDALHEIEEMGLDARQPDVLEQYLRIKSEASAPPARVTLTPQETARAMGERVTLTPGEFVDVVAAELGVFDHGSDVAHAGDWRSFVGNVRDALELVTFAGS